MTHKVAIVGNEVAITRNKATVMTNKVRRAGRGFHSNGNMFV